MPSYLISFPVVRTNYESITIEAESEADALEEAFYQVKYRGDEPIDPCDLEIEVLNDE